MRSLENFNYIEQFTGVKPDVKEMNRVEQEQGAPESSVEKRLQELFKKEDRIDNDKRIIFFIIITSL